MSDLSPEPADSARLAEMNAMARGTLSDHLGIVLTALSSECVVATMPVQRSVHQPFGILHGGASVALAETVASIAGWLNVDAATEMAVGIEINANHIRAVREGLVTATATPLHRGRSTQVWEVKIVDERDRLVCISRCTLGVRPRADK